MDQSNQNTTDTGSKNTQEGSLALSRRKKRRKSGW